MIQQNQTCINETEYHTTTEDKHKTRPRFSWWHGTVVERRSLAGELSLSCARPAADG